VTRGRAEIDERSALAGLVPRFDGVRPDFHLQRRGDSVAGFVSVVFVILAVIVNVDEPGGHNQSRGVDRVFSGDRAGGDG